MNARQGGSPAAADASGIDPRVECLGHLLEAALQLRKAEQAAEGALNEKLAKKCELARWAVSQAIKHADQERVGTLRAIASRGAP